MIKVITFGPIKDIIKKEELFEQVKDTDQLVHQLQERYPKLAGMPYIIAVDKNVISINTMLPGDHVVALLPPYSGG